MGLFNRKSKGIREVRDGAWGHLVSVHKVNVDILSNEMRCVELEGTLEGKGIVTFLRVFKPKEAERQGVTVTGWDTFDKHPELVLFEGYLTRANEANLTRKNA